MGDRQQEMTKKAGNKGETGRAGRMGQQAAKVSSVHTKEHLFYEGRGWGGERGHSSHRAWVFPWKKQVRSLRS